MKNEILGLMVATSLFTTGCDRIGKQNEELSTAIRDRYTLLLPPRDKTGEIYTLPTGEVVTLGMKNDDTLQMANISNPDGTTHYDSDADGDFDMTGYTDGTFTDIYDYKGRSTLPTTYNIGVYALDILTRLTIQRQEQIVATPEGGDTNAE